MSDPSKSCDYEPFSQPAHSDFTVVKHEHKSASGSGSKNQQLGTNAATFSRPQKVLTLEKYREKHAAELALQNGVKEEPGTDMYAPPPALTSSHHHKKRSQSQQAGQSGEGRREKSSSKKPRLPPSFSENGSATSEELKMRIKVSSDRHGGSEQGSSLPVKDKHKEHSSHRHSKHGHSHAYSLSGNSRGTIDNASLSIRAPGNDGSSSGSSRKRPHSDAANHNHHHHSSKSGRSSKGGISSSHYATESSQRMMEHHGHDGTNGMLTSNGQHTDYKDTFDMLDSLLSAQGMNL